MWSNTYHTSYIFTVGCIIYQLKITPGPFAIQSRIKIFDSDTTIKTLLDYFLRVTSCLSGEDFPRESLLRAGPVLGAGDSMIDKIVPGSVLLELTA